MTFHGVRAGSRGHVWLFVQVLGDKPELPEGHSDSLKVDACHRKEARLYMVTKSICKRSRSPPTTERSPLCQVSNVSGDTEVTLVAEHSPFSQDALLSSECFILDNGANGHIYVWKGCNIFLFRVFVPEGSGPSELEPTDLNQSWRGSVCV